MKDGATTHRILAFALAVAGLLGCGSDNTGPKTGTSGNEAGTDGGEAGAGGNEAGTSVSDAAADADATLDAPNGSDAESGTPGDAGADGPITDGGPDAPAIADASDGSAAGPVKFSIDMNKGPARQFQAPATPVPVSPYIYGINGFGTFVKQKTRWGLIRKGGNTYSAWNWTINYLNAGSTECFWQGQAGGGATLAGAVTQDMDAIPAAQAAGEAFLATVPIGEHVAAAVINDTSVNNLCPVTASDCMSASGMAPSTGVNSNHLDFVSTDMASPAFVPNAASKPGAFCLCPPSEPCDAGCAVSTNPVYQDEFVNFIKTNYGAGGAPIFFELDNEPNYWAGVHPELWPFTGTLPCQTATTPTYDDIVSRDKQFAAAVKKAWPATKVFGPVVSQDGIIYAHSYDMDVHSPTEFLDYYLGEMAKASATAGTALLDVVDLHYYNENATVTQCVQNPRMFWDPNYTAISPAMTDDIDFAYSNDYLDTTWYPRRLIPRILDKIAKAYPSGSSLAAPGLAFSEYNSGCESFIEGALAEADDLGVFGREGVFAATAWPEQKNLAANYLVAAFDLYRNYDGNGATVGDMAVAATTSDVDATSIYAFAHSTDASALDAVAINKTSNDLPVTISIASAAELTAAKLYAIGNGTAAVVPVASAPPVVTCTAGMCSLTYTLPALSATTVVLRATKD